MNLYLITQSETNDYDTYDSAVVAAETEGDARRTHPGKVEWVEENNEWKYQSETWCKHPSSVEVKLIGFAAPFTDPGVICASFNAG